VRARGRGVALALALAGCAGTSSSGGVQDPSGVAADDVVAGEIVVFAAASLTEAFEDIASAFEAEHPGADVVLNLAGSSTLATQIVAGAPADVFASADTAQMDAVAGAGLAEDPTTFAINGLEIVVEAGNPLAIEELEDLARDDVVLVLAAPEVPAGAFAAQVLDAQGVEVSPASLELDVRATLSRVELGEADAAIVYRSDVATASDAVEGIVIPDERNVAAEYPIATVTGSSNPDAAAAFVAFVRSDAGQRSLADAGFTAP
jgi:molybdate transport system substrate-binding protein